MQRGVAHRVSALRPNQAKFCVVLACDKREEAEQIGIEFSKINNGYLQVYTRICDLLNNLPTGRVILVILATGDSPVVMDQALQWIRQRWPRCHITVVADAGCNNHEMAARQNGASFLIRPVTAEQWATIVSHAAGRDEFVGRRERPYRGLTAR